MRFLYGDTLANDLLASLRVRRKELSRSPGLAAVYVGDNTASQMYVRMKERAAERVGIHFVECKLPQESSQQTCAEHIKRLNADEMIDGILVQLPLPSQIKTQSLLNLVEADKDVDGLRQGAKSLFTCPFPKAIMMLLKDARVPMLGERGVVLANSDGFGETMVRVMRHDGIHADVVLKSEYAKRSELVKNALFVVTALGSPGFLRGDMIRKGAVVIDGGIEKIQDKTVGDVEVDSVSAVASFLSPVPGGVGPLTIACLLENVFLAAENHQKKHG